MRTTVLICNICTYILVYRRAVAWQSIYFWNPLVSADMIVLMFFCLRYTILANDSAAEHKKWKWVNRNAISQRHKKQKILRWQSHSTRGARSTLRDSHMFFSKKIERIQKKWKKFVFRRVSWSSVRVNEFLQFCLGRCFYSKPRI